MTMTETISNTTRYTWAQVYHGVRSLSPDETPRPCADLTYLTLADKIPIQTDDVNRRIQGNVAMQVMPPGGQICNLCKWRYLVAKFATMQVAPTFGQICN